MNAIRAHVQFRPEPSELIEATVGTQGRQTHYTVAGAALTLCGRRWTAAGVRSDHQRAIASCYSCLEAAGERRRASRR